MEAEKVICPNCGQVCEFTAIYCPNCNENLRDFLPGQSNRDSAQTILVPQETSELSPHLHSRRAYFSRSTRLVLYILETDQHIPVDFEQYVTIGRDQTQGEPHIDLTAHNASNLGVSRRHARFIRTQATIMIEDLGALNGSYLNGEKLSPSRAYVMCDGDELRLGAMIMAVVFEKQHS